MHGVNEIQLWQIKSSTAGILLCFVYIHAIFQFPIIFVYMDISPFAPGDFAEKRVLKLVEWLAFLVTVVL